MPPPNHPAFQEPRRNKVIVALAVVVFLVVVKWGTSFVQW